MSVINKLPLISEILANLSAEQLSDLKDCINGLGGTPIFRTLKPISNNHLTASDKGVKPINIELATILGGMPVWEGYLIYTDTMCYVICYSGDKNQGLNILKVDVAKNAAELVNGGLSILELRSELDDAMNAGGGESGPTPIATIDGVDYFHVIKEVDLVGTTTKTINIQTGEVSEGDEIPNLISSPMDKRYWKLTSYLNQQVAPPVSVITRLTFGPSGKTEEGIIPIVGAINTRNGLYEEYFTNGYVKKDANDKFEFYFNLTHEGSGSEKITSSDIDSETATVGQVLTADGSGGAAWQNVASDGDFEEIDISQNGISTWGQLYEALGSTIVSHKLIKLTWRDDVRVQTKEYGITISHPYGDVYLITLAPAYADEMTRYYTYYSAYGALSTISEQTIYSSYVERQLLPSTKNTHSGQTYFAKLDTSGNAVWVEDAGSAGGTQLYRHYLHFSNLNGTSTSDYMDLISTKSEAITINSDYGIYKLDAPVGKTWLARQFDSNLNLILGLKDGPNGLIMLQGYDISNNNIITNLINSSSVLDSDTVTPL